MRKTLRIQPLAAIYDLSQAPFNASPLTAQWPSMNVMVSSNRIERRWDHEVYRTFASGDVIQAVPIFRTNDGTIYTLVLTETDLIKITGATSTDTYQYLTQTYGGAAASADGHITNITGDTITGDSTCDFLDDSGAEDGDKFILDENHEAAKEPSGTVAKPNPWITLHTDGTHVITNDYIYTEGTYAGTTGDLLSDPKHYKIRKVYSVPTGERWQYANVNGKFCFVNGNVFGQYWNGTDTYATDINTTYCKKVRYCVSYANRLVTADMEVSGARNPWYVRWSKEGDPTNWTDTTAGFNDFMDTEEPITGLGVVGANIVVFKKTSYHLGWRTGEAASPIIFPENRRGIGLYAPYSLVHVAGTVAWMGLNDFYCMNGAEAVSIGEDIRKKFFDLVADDELESVFGINNSRYNEVLWVANTSAGQYVFVYNWKEKGIHSGTWTTYQFDSDISGLGGWA